MNIVRKVFHRTFNGVMRMLLPFFPYREPKPLQSAAEVVEVLRKEGITSLLLIAGKTVRGHGLTKEIESLMSDAGIRVAIYDGTQPNPTSDNVEAARLVYLENECQAIIAFGGGSAMDCAKAVGARIVRPNMPLKNMAGLIKIRRRLPLFIAIPTTAGTGSETTVASVIIDSKTHHKYVINDFSLIPDYALLDPMLTVGLPKHLTATTGMDALTHAVEVYVGKARTRETKIAAERSVRLIFENLERAYENGDDIEARRNMLLASYLAGTAFTKSYVGYVHAVAHTLGGKYGVAHGLANAVLLPLILREYGEEATKSLAELARATGLVDPDTDDSTAKEALISHIEGMNRRMGIGRHLDCIRREDIQDMARLADKEANPLYPTPVLWDRAELEKIYLLALGENNI